MSRATPVQHPADDPRYTDRTRERQFRVVNFKNYRNRNASAFCEACGWTPPSALPRWYLMLHAHHVVPVAAGGSDADDNLALLCPTCHALAHRCGRLQHVAEGRQWTGPTTKAGLLVQVRELVEACTYRRPEPRA